MFNPISILSTTGNIASKLYGFYNLTTDDVVNGLYDAATPRNIAYASIAVTAAGTVIAYPPTRIALCAFLSMTYSMTLITFHLVIMGLYFAFATAQGIGSGVGSTASTLASLASQASAGKEKVPDQISKINQWAEEARSQSMTQPDGLSDIEMDAVFKDLEQHDKKTTPQSVAPKVVNDDWSKIIEESELLNPKNWVEEYAEGAATKVAANNWAAEFLPEARPVIGAVTKQATEAAQWVNEFHGEEMVQEFLKTQKKSGGMGKKLLVGVGITAAAVFTAYQLYQVVKEARSALKEEAVTTSSYANVSSDALYEDYDFPSFAPQINLM